MVFIVCFILMALLLGNSLSGTLAGSASADFTASFSNPYPSAYNRTIEVGAKYSMPTVTQAFAWLNADDTILAMSYPEGLSKPSLLGLKPGVSVVTVGTRIGQICPYRFLVVDPANITSYTLKGGAEGRIAAKNQTLSIPVTTIPAGSAGKISWSSLNDAVATVSGATVKAVVDAGAAVVLGKFTDPWGLEHTIPYLVVIGGSPGPGPGPNPGHVKGPDGHWYRPLGRPSHIYEVLDENGDSKEPAEYVYSPDGIPGNGEDRRGHAGINGSFWAEGAGNSGIWQEIISPGEKGFLNMPHMDLVLNRENGHIMLPLKYTESLGYTVSWNKMTNIVELEKNKNRIDFVPDKDNTVANLYEQDQVYIGYLNYYCIDILYDDVYVSLNFIADLLQCDVGWDKASSQIQITEKGNGIDIGFFQGKLSEAYIGEQINQDNGAKERYIKTVNQYRGDPYNQFRFMPEAIVNFNNNYYGTIFAYLDVKPFFGCYAMKLNKIIGDEWLVFSYDSVEDAGNAILMFNGWKAARYAQYNAKTYPTIPAILPGAATYTLGDPAIEFILIQYGGDPISGTGYSNDKVDWALDKPGATISNIGSFRATAAGAYTITATAKGSATVVATAKVTVIDP